MQTDSAGRFVRPFIMKYTEQLSEHGQKYAPTKKL